MLDHRFTLVADSKPDGTERDDLTCYFGVAIEGTPAIVLVACTLDPSDPDVWASERIIERWLDLPGGEEKGEPIAMKASVRELSPLALFLEHHEAVVRARRMHWHEWWSEQGESAWPEPRMEWRV